MSETTKNPMSGDDIAEEDAIIDEEERDLRSSLAKKPSEAYMESRRKSSSMRRNLEKSGKSSLDFDFKDHEDETAHIPVDFNNTTSVSPIQKLRKIGKKTVCMASCLLIFGVSMMISSFFYLHHVQDGGKGFILFFMIGLCATIPGAYATYNIIGKYNGW